MTPWNLSCFWQCEKWQDISTSLILQQSSGQSFESSLKTVSLWKSWYVRMKAVASDFLTSVHMANTTEWYMNISWLKWMRSFKKCNPWHSWSEIWGFHSSENSSWGLLGYDAVQCRGRIPMIQRSTLPSSSDLQGKVTSYHDTTQCHNPENLDLK
jgi:hypothetical protein